MNHPNFIRLSAAASAVVLYRPLSFAVTDRSPAVRLTFRAAGAGGAWSAERQERLSFENGAAILDLSAASAALVAFESE
jgi:hypothetical protein